ncbi:MAG: helix-turn-helix transcriptional regulator [Beijerinckiaceae bacterium]
MRRADRLLDLVARLKARPLTRAEDLAEAMETSVRTIYRDIAVLQAQGLPIEGQAGVGYMLRGAIDLPPLVFDHDQLEALALGLAYVEQVGDADLAAAARGARAKIDAAWAGEPTPPPSKRRLRARQMPEHRAPAFASMLRAALRARRMVSFAYCDALQALTQRCVRPLALTAFSNGWLLIAWCPDRDDFRHFRLDRMQHVAVANISFSDEPGRDLETYLMQRGAQSMRPPRVCGSIPG